MSNIILNSSDSVYLSEDLVNRVANSLKTGIPDENLPDIPAKEAVNIAKKAITQLLGEIEDFLSQDEALAILKDEITLPPPKVSFTVSERGIEEIKESLSLEEIEELAFERIATLRDAFVKIIGEDHVPENILNIDTYAEPLNKVKQELDENLEKMWRGNGIDGYGGTGIKSRIYYLFDAAYAYPSIDAPIQEIREFLKKEKNKSHHIYISELVIRNLDLKFVPLEIVKTFRMRSLQITQQRPIQLWPRELEKTCIQSLELQGVKFRDLSPALQKRLIHFGNGHGLGYTVNHPQWGDMVRNSIKEKKKEREEARQKEEETEAELMAKDAEETLKRVKEMRKAEQLNLTQ